mmetsp:Transcript_51192/g.119403  ORF Transcript_51192/g.119403 Transcript_51192/m.119403 type:complete len:82 (-) Transcript_51192:414-659(-)
MEELQLIVSGSEHPLIVLKIWQAVDHVREGAQQLIALLYDTLADLVKLFAMICKNRNATSHCPGFSAALIPVVSAMTFSCG